MDPKKIPDGWALLDKEPCRFCHVVGKVMFKIDDGGPESKNDFQPMVCLACGRSWQCDSPLA